MNWSGLILFMAIPTICGITAMVEECSWKAVFFTVLLIGGIEVMGGIAFLIMFD